MTIKNYFWIVEYDQNVLSIQVSKILFEVIVLKEWDCVEVGHHRDIGRVIEAWQRNGWSLHSYQATGKGSGPMSFQIYHYLLFERGT